LTFCDYKHFVAKVVTLVTNDKEPSKISLKISKISKPSASVVGLELFYDEKKIGNIESRGDVLLEQTRFATVL
jgi:hypothetical protein